MSRPRHRPQNITRIQSMLHCFEMAFDSVIIRDGKGYEDLYGRMKSECNDEAHNEREEFEYMDEAEKASLVDKESIDPSEELELELSLVRRYRAIMALTDQKQRDEALNELDELEDRIAEWHELRASLLEPLSSAPRGDKMLVYRIAAALFNNQLESDQRGDALLGIEPKRLDEKPISPAGIQRAIHRYKSSV